MPVDASAGVISRSRLAGVIHLDGHYILTIPIHVRRRIIGETDVPERPQTKVMAVDPDLAVAEHAIELDGNFAALIRRRNAKALPVPTDSGGCGGAGPAAGLVLGERPFDAPVVG